MEAQELEQQAREDEEYQRERWNEENCNGALLSIYQGWSNIDLYDGDDEEDW